MLLLKNGNGNHSDKFREAIYRLRWDQCQVLADCKNNISESEDGQWEKKKKNFPSFRGT